MLNIISKESILQYIYDMIIFLGINTFDRYTTIYGKFCFFLCDKIKYLQFPLQKNKISF